MVTRLLLSECSNYCATRLQKEPVLQTDQHARLSESKAPIQGYLQQAQSVGGGAWDAILDHRASAKGAGRNNPRDATTLGGKIARRDYTFHCRLETY